MSGYKSDSCSALEKTYYKPIEAALRWCGLIEHEAEILSRMDSKHIPELSDFPQWPCLRINVEKIFDAVFNDKIAYGRDGRTVSSNEQVAKNRITVRHEDLREWMVKNYPGQKPDFLFDSIEQNAHGAITTETFHTMRSEIESLRKVKATLEFEIADLQRKNQTLIEKNGRLESSSAGNGLNPRLERTYTNIIAALLECILGESGNDPHPSFRNVTDLAAKISEYYGDYDGLSRRNLDEKFAKIRKDFKAQ